MKLIEYIKNIFKDGPELWSDEKIMINDKCVSIRRDTKRLRDCSLGLISSNSAEEWYRICRLNCEPGTIIEEYKEEEWSCLYNDMLSLVRNELTKSLLEERQSKGAKTLLEILTRRDNQHWAEEKQTKTATTTINKETNDIIVKFEVKE